VTEKIETIESQLATTTSSTDDVYTKEELKDEKKSLNKQLESLQIQLQSWIERLPKGINIYNYFYFILYHIINLFII
jgi:hypothetical protein